MKKFTNVINWGLLFSIPILLLTVNINTKTIDSNVDTKELATSLVAKTELEEVKAIEQTSAEDISEKEEQIQVKEQQVKKQEEQKKEVTTSVEPAKPEEKVEIKEEKPSDVIATYTGTMSYYYANCTGCSGITSTGVDVSDGRVYYHDNTYGNVRIIAAGTEIPKWSIVRLKNTSFGTNTLAIVLDRGGAIGVGKTFLIDMLTNSTENKGGIENVTVEVIRKGK